MSSEENKRFYQKFLDLQTDLKLDDLDEFMDTYFTLGYIQHNLGPQGNELNYPAMREAGRQWYTDFHDIHIHVDDILAEGDRVAVRGNTTAIETATGELESWDFFCIVRISGGKVAEEWQLVAQVPAKEKAT